MNSNFILLVLIFLYLLMIVSSMSERQYGKALYFTGSAILTVGILIMKG